VSVAKGLTQSHSISEAPFYEYIKRWIVSSRTFQTIDEFLTLALQAVKAQPKGHFVIKVPSRKALFVRACFVREPWIPNALRSRALERIQRSLGPERKVPAALPAAPTYQLPAPEVKSPETDPPPPKDYSLDWS
jgi:hypothetical protein